MSEMPNSPVFLSAADRDSQKYELLVRALSSATQHLRSLAGGGQFEVDDFLRRMLPYYIEAFEAHGGFVLRQSLHAAKENEFEFVIGRRDEWPGAIESVWLAELVQADKAQIVRDVQKAGIAQFAQLGIENCIIAPLRTFDHAFVLGVCNKQHAEQYPFLAADRIVLESLLTSISATLRTSERLYREHRAVQEITQEISNGDLRILEDRVVQHVAALSKCRYVSLYSYDPQQKQLRQLCDWDDVNKTRLQSSAPLPLDQPSLNAKVADGSESKYVPDLRQADLPLNRAKFQEDAAAVYCVRLTSRGELVGTLCVATPAPDGIAEEDRRTVDRLAPLVAVALHNALLNQEKQAQLELDEDVIRLQDAIANVLVEEQQAQQVLEALRSRFPDEDNFFIATYDEPIETIRLRIVYENGKRVKNLAKHPAYRKRRINNRRGLIDYMVRHDVPTLNVEDFDQWPDRSKIEGAYSQGIKCCLIVELKLPDGSRVGWLGFRGTQRPGMFSPAQRQLLERLAPHIAIVLRNAQEYEARARERQVVSDFQTNISGLNETEGAEIEQIVTMLRNSLGQLNLQTEDLYLALYDEDKRTIHVPVAFRRGRSLSAEERRDYPAYRDRALDERKGFTEWIISSRRHILARNAKAIAGWRNQEVDAPPVEFKCWLGVPMIAAGRVVGVMALRSETEENVFTELHAELLQTIGNQAAVTIENARRYQRINDLSEQRNALYQASRAIIVAGLELPHMLQTIVKEAAEKTDGHLGTIYLSNETGDILNLAVGYPSSAYDLLKASPHTQIDVNSEHYIVARAMRENAVQLVPRVRDDPAFVDVSEGVTQSQLTVVLREGGKKEGRRLGVISVEHKDVNGLDDNDRQFLISLSNMAVAAIQNAKRVKDLARNRSIAVMGAWGADVVHDINREVSRIRETILEIGERPEIQVKLDAIDKAAECMLLPQLPSSNPSRDSEGVSVFPEIDRVLQAEIETYRPRYQQLSGTESTITFSGACPGKRVCIHEAWVRRLLRHYLTNAERYPPSHGTLRIQVSTTVEGEKVIVNVEDNGSGVRPEIREQLFDLPISHSEGPQGKGLVLVRTICEIHGGSAWLDWSETGSGSRFAFSVPLYDEPRDGEKAQ